jgi:hypothetical protein
MPVSRYPDQRLPARRSLPPDWGLVARNGLSLTCNNDALSGATIPGSKLPACCFALHQTFPLPGPLPAPLPDPVCTRLRHLPRGMPVAASPSSATDCFSGLHSPSGVLPPSGSKRSTGPAASSTRLPNPPDFLSLPAAVSITRVQAADHRSWSATFPVACCSSNLLEPHSLCSRTAFPSSLFVTFFSYFPQYLSFVFSAS